MALTDDWEVRARLGRAAGVWMGGLDGPPPTVDELESTVRLLAASRAPKLVHARDHLRDTLLALDSCNGRKAVEHLGYVVSASRAVIAALDES